MLRTLALFIIAAIAEIGGAWLVWQGVREHRGALFVGAGIVALAGYSFVATLQPDAHFGRILAAYGGIFVAGSLAWGVVANGFRPDRYDLLGAALCLVGVAVIMFVASRLHMTRDNRRPPGTLGASGQDGHGRHVLRLSRKEPGRPEQSSRLTLVVLVAGRCEEALSLPIYANIRFCRWSRTFRLWR